MKIVYAGPFFYPSSQANSLRVRGMIEALVAAGHDVHVVCLGEEWSGEEINGVRITRIPEYDEGVLARLGSGLRGLFLGDVTACWLDRNETKLDALILYGTHSGYLLRMDKFCRRRGVKFLLDVVEWYQPSHLPGGALGPFSIANELSMRLLARRADGVFAISRYLESHFEELGLPVLRVPPLFNPISRNAPSYRAEDGKLHVCYAGTPGRKELFGNLFAGLKDASDAGASIRMHVVGMTAESARAQGLSVGELGAIVKFHGRVPNDEAVSVIRSCDFMLMLRPDQRFSRAGFPSKVVESLCCGTPIITNSFSNLSDYLRDGENAIMIRGVDPILVSESLQRAARLSDESLGVMRASALASSSAFTPKAHAAQIGAFISGNQ